VRSDEYLLDEFGVDMILGPPPDPDLLLPEVEQAESERVATACEIQFGFRPMGWRRGVYFSELGSRLHCRSGYAQDRIDGLKMRLKAEFDRLAREAVARGKPEWFRTPDARLSVESVMFGCHPEVVQAIREEHPDLITALKSDTFIPPRQ
jgi:hypothetical protein